LLRIEKRSASRYDFFGAVGFPSLPLVVLFSADPAAITFTSGLRHSFLATGDLL
jgi:hypothetical protein